MVHDDDARRKEEAEWNELVGRVIRRSGWSTTPVTIFHNKLAYKRS